MNFSTKFVSAGKEYSTYEKAVPSPYMRHTFNLNEKPENAKIVICGLGFYELYVNGKNITKGELAPYISNPDHILYYDEYDLVEYLQKGKNAIGIQLGNGRLNNLHPVWDFDKFKCRSAPKVAFEFTSDELSFDAESLVCHPSALYFDGLHEGNHYDARLEISGWADADFDDSAWTPAISAETPRGKTKLCTAEPIKRFEEHSPIRIAKGRLTKNRNVYARMFEYVSRYFEDGVPTEGGYIYDFGVNMAGIIRLKIKGYAGQKIRLQYTDVAWENTVNRTTHGCYPDGFCQTDTFICSGGDDVFEDKFTYFGFRYVYVYGITEEQANESLLTAIEIHSSLDEIGSFECSDEVANKLYKMCSRSDITNFHYFLTDCPHREKNGWTGDSSASAEHVILKYEASDSWEEWLANIRAVQADDGSLPGIVPTETWGFAWGNGPVWDSVLFNIPYVLYVYRKNTDVIRDNAHAMMRYLEYISKKAKDDGTYELGLGDWLPVRKKTDAAPLSIASTLTVMDIAKKACVMFEAVGLTLQASFANALYERTRSAFREVLIDKSDYTVFGAVQSAQALALYYGAFDEGEYAAAYRRLIELIREDGNSLSGGFLGLRVVFHVLAANGDAELAYNMICKKEYPSYGYLVNPALDFTTMPESLSEEFVTPELLETKENGSLNHHFFGDIAHFFVRHVVGINIDRDRIVIKPNFIKSLDFAEASYKLHDGETVCVKWHREGENVIVTVLGASHVFEAPSGYKISDKSLTSYTLTK